MHSIGSRANAVLAYCSFVVFGFLFLNFLSAKFLLQIDTPNITLELSRIDKLRKHVHSESDQALIIFKLEADLAPLFNWNTKQLFVYITAEYQTSANKLNEVVIWDKIIQYKEDATLSFPMERSKYVLSDQGYGLRNADVNLTLSWNLIPITGPLEKIKAAGKTLRFPSEYTS